MVTNSWRPLNVVRRTNHKGMREEEDKDKERRGRVVVTFVLADVEWTTS